MPDNNLHSINKLQDDIKAAKWLSVFLPKKKRQQIKELETSLANMIYLIESFNKYFSDAGWCAYDSMNMPLMENAVKAYEAGGIDAGEQVLIQYYQTDVKDIMHWLKNKAKPFRERYELIKCAFDDHFAERYHASVPLFLIIIDGAVNDYTKSKGFFAEGTDVSAWDCLVGCGDGLTKIKDIFKKGRNKTNHDEIRLPYRNGILHGRDLNYANKYVSCKCISLMFALADWMNMKDSENTRKQKFEKECNPPPISESLKKIKQNAIDRQEIQKWVKRDIKIGETISATPTIEECKDFPYLLPLISAFNAWSTRNYGSLSVWFKNVFSYESSDKKRAGECRKLFDHKNLISYELEEIEERALALTKIVVLVKWKSNDIVHTEHFEFGCSYQQEDGNVGYPWKNNVSLRWECWSRTFWSRRSATHKKHPDRKSPARCKVSSTKPSTRRKESCT